MMMIFPEIRRAH